MRYRRPSATIGGSVPAAPAPLGRAGLAFPTNPPGSRLPLLWLLLLFALITGCASGQPNIRKLTILHTNDLHARLLPDAEGRGGFAYVAAAIREEKAKSDATLVLHAGDFVQGTPVSTIFRGRARLGGGQPPGRRREHLGQSRVRLRLGADPQVHPGRRFSDCHGESGQRRRQAAHAEPLRHSRSQRHPRCRDRVDDRASGRADALGFSGPLARPAAGRNRRALCQGSARQGGPGRRAGSPVQRGGRRGSPPGARHARPGQRPQPRRRGSRQRLSGPHLRQGQGLRPRAGPARSRSRRAQQESRLLPLAAHSDRDFPLSSPTRPWRRSSTNGRKKSPT